ncbi:sensor histidine kinase [Novosphingobium album (ex Hu et al. 2023)]|uniref:histidine kinase n=1 Tax=Novosphingobium album (ex Hu et al. 2023) TaxID=2930093 RepID=A0ABT0B3L8_9SPHN|nr:sensor histidine kinase [Novosphingobium album (ex Hu et al. 2023)]MCJ2179429.1 sensor histidine kinase [Novosphingobium album (ex Hu et al. 2023)]
MHFDDRLDTVLRLPDSGDGLARIQYRQLIDILGRLPADAESEALEAGFARLAALSLRIPAADQARLLRQPLQPITNPRLIAILAQAEPGVASAAIGAARLRDSEWLALIPELPVRARGILRHRRDLSATVEALLEQLGVHDRGLPPATMPAAADDYNSGDVLELLDMIEDPPAPTSLHDWAQARAARAKTTAASPASSATAEAGIGAIVRRIEEFRKARESLSHADAGTDAPRLPLGDTVPASERLAKVIDFATDAEGRINWADGPFAPAVFGLNLAANDDDTSASPNPGAAMRRRQPLRAARLSVNGAPAVSGEWQVDAVPRFDPVAGHFTGYCGRLRRPRPRITDDAAAVARREAGRMREILHELRTPANAIQVAAEIIQQQLYGPAPHEYRALAAAIASDCAHILAGFEELDRLVKLETGAQQLEAGECDLAQALAKTVMSLRSWTDPRRSGFIVDAHAAPATLLVPLDDAEASRMIWRLLAVLAGATAPDEPLALTWSATGQDVTVRIALPAALATCEDGDLFGAQNGERGHSLMAGMFGAGFTLRLAAAEAAAAGGSLQRDGDALCLRLPGLTAANADHSNVESYSQ